MAKIVDPVLDYFLQIPLSEGNILQFLSRNGFRVSKVQHPDGSTKSLIFYYVSFPSKSVQFQDNDRGVENFLFNLQEVLFFVLDETEMTFIVKTPRFEQGLAIERGGEDMTFMARRVKYTGEKSASLDDEIEDKTTLHLTKEKNTFHLPHAVLQNIFESFISTKKLVKIDKVMQDYRDTHGNKADDMYV